MKKKVIKNGAREIARSLIREGLIDRGEDIRFCSDCNGKTIF